MEEIKDNPHARIYRAGLRGTGVRLSANEVERLMLDDAIIQAAQTWMDENGFEYRDGEIVKRTATLPAAAAPGP
jgi:hypothetical protein